MVGIVSGIKIFQEKRRTERANLRLQKNAADTEISYLAGQINPHFIVNTINNIYFLIDKDKEAAADMMLLRFSGLLRYQRYECTAQQVDIAHEIEFLGKYI